MSRVFFSEDSEGIQVGDVVSTVLLLLWPHSTQVVIHTDACSGTDRAGS